MNTSETSFRPDTYWPDSLTPDQLLMRIRGKERQDIARSLFEQQGFTALSQFLVREGLDEPDRTAWGRQGPWCMGGEYLPELFEGEVEIARISMKSTTSDQISVRALREGDQIRYRIVGEYEDDGMSYILPFETSDLPLTMSELLEFIDGAKQDGDCYPGGIFTSSWSMLTEFGTDPEEIINFLSPSSAFYPSINECYTVLAYDWLEEHTDSDEEASI
jgi:hypothetical protein